jgi:hypothetical protein
MTSVHSKPVQTGQYALLKITSQRHCISNVRHDPGYGLDAVTTWHGFASAGGHNFIKKCTIFAKIKSFENPG